MINKVLASDKLSNAEKTFKAKSLYAENKESIVRLTGAEFVQVKTCMDDLLRIYK